VMGLTWVAFCRPAWEFSASSHDLTNVPTREASGILMRMNAEKFYCREKLWSTWDFELWSWMGKERPWKLCWESSLHIIQVKKVLGQVES
jgi:hypothetical protein